MQLSNIVCSPVDDIGPSCEVAAFPGVQQDGWRDEAEVRCTGWPNSSGHLGLWLGMEECCGHVHVVQNPK